MKPANPKASLRCAVYTRVSTEHGLDLEFNSLDNQREASDAYIKSQAHEGWRLMRDHYDDGGFSGGSMERPALKKLLDAVRARRIDVIVVYKVVGSVARVPAMELERRVVDAVRGAAPTDPRERSIETEIIRRVSDRPVAVNSAAVGSSPRVLDPGADICAAVERITIRRTTLEIQLAEGTAGDCSDRILVVPWTPPSPHRRREIIQGESGRSAAPRPMRAEARALLIDALRDAYCWQDELMRDSSRTIESIAAREKKTERSIRMTLSLAFLSPALVKAAIEGRLSRGFGVKRLMDLPMGWSDQWSALGLKAPARA